MAGCLGLIALGDHVVRGEADLDRGDNSPAIIVDGSLRAQRIVLGDNLIYVRRDLVARDVVANGAGLVTVDGHIRTTTWHAPDFSVRCADPDWEP